jgi:hypothetical protein
MESQTRSAVIAASATILAAVILVYGPRLRPDQIKTVDAQPTEAPKKMASVLTPGSLPPIPRPTRVVVHMTTNDTELFTRVQSSLVQAGYDVAHVRVIDSRRFPLHSQVRYFRPSDAPDAEKLVGVLRESGVVEVEKELIAGYASSARVNQFEVWVRP